MTQHPTAVNHYLNLGRAGFVDKGNASVYSGDRFARPRPCPSSSKPLACRFEDEEEGQGRRPTDTVRTTEVH
jgi:hypothetical protein